MKRQPCYYVYIMTNKWNRVLYTGMTNDLARRVYEHQSGDHNGFTRRYHLKKLVYYEEYATPQEAIHREKQIKKGSRKRKLELISAMNPHWVDLNNMFD